MGKGIRTYPKKPIRCTRWEFLIHQFCKYRGEITPLMGVKKPPGPTQLYCPFIEIIAQFIAIVGTHLVLEGLKGDGAHMCFFLLEFSSFLQEAGFLLGYVFTHFID